MALLVVLAAGISIHLELRIRRAAAEIGRLRHIPASPAAVSQAQAARDANPGLPQTAALSSDSAARDGRGWVPDLALMEQEWKRAKAAMGGSDFEIIRRATNQIRVRQRFHELYETLGLSEAEIAIFEKEAADKNLTFTELVSPNPADGEIHQQAQARSMDRIVESTLGRDYVEPFRAFLLTSDLRDTTEELAAFSLGAGEPLNPDQAAALLQASLEFRQTKVGASRTDPDLVDWESVATRSQEFLTPAQQRLLRAMIDRRKFDRMFRDITGLPLHFPIRGL